MKQNTARLPLLVGAPMLAALLIALILLACPPSSYASGLAHVVAARPI